jgi:hypothetical protein
MRPNKYSAYIILAVSLILSACDKHKSRANTNLNPEIIGSWSNEDGCAATFAGQNGHLILTKFTDASRHVSFTQVKLASLKENIFSKFNSSDPQIKFSGMFSEGQIIIDNYCKKALHKIDSH